MNTYLYIITGILVGGYLINTVVTLLNLASLTPELPGDFIGVYDQILYVRSQEYARQTSRLSMVHDTVNLVLILLFITAGGFNVLDLAARSAHLPEILTGLLFTGMLALLSSLVNLPFTIYSTFVLEQRFGFNTTTLSTFLLDRLKTAVLAVLLGGPLLAGILWFFERSGQAAWVYCWIASAAFILTIQFVAPAWIMPLFNTFTPLKDGELKEAINTYAESQQFAIQGIYTMDGSKRSTRANAFFTGFGRFRRIVFFDTLMEKLSTSEIVAVLAHEMGHYKRRHILAMTILSLLQMGLTFFILSNFIGNRGLFDAFGMEHLSVYAGLVFFGFLYSPISTLLAVGFNVFSRRNEYQADDYAKQSLGEATALISGLKKLSISNLANLTPHPLHVFLNYSHPPVLARIKALRLPSRPQPGDN